MSRGPGRWERALLEAVNEHPSVAPSGRRYVHVRSWLRTFVGREPTPAELSAAHRAARSIVRKGLADTSTRKFGFVGDLEPLQTVTDQ